MCNPHLRYGKVCSTFLRVASTLNVWNSSAQICPFSPIYLYMQIFICMSIWHRYSFYALGYISVVLYFVVHFIPRFGLGNL